MNVLYIVAAIVALGIPAAIILGSRGRTVDARHGGKTRVGGRREGDKAAA